MNDRGLAVLVLLVLFACTSSPSDSGTPVATERPSATSPSPSPSHAQFTSIRDALAFIRQKVDVPVLLPKGLPLGVALAPKHAVYSVPNRPVGWMLHLMFGTKRHVFIQFESGTFDGCDTAGADVASVRGMPALVYTTTAPGLWTEVIWPATFPHPIGRYGLAGSFSAARILRMAATMPVVDANPHAVWSC